jgi:hypothetical protein
MRGRRFLLALIGVLVVAAGVIAYRALSRPQVSAADLLTPLDVQLIQSDLDAGNPRWQVLIEASNPYLADASRFGTDQATIRCSTKTYFDRDVNHATVRAVTPLKFSATRELTCWTSSGSSPAPPSS